jgi:hypothetical protein
MRAWGHPTLVKIWFAWLSCRCLPDRETWTISEVSKLRCPTVHDDRFSFIRKLFVHPGFGLFARNTSSHSRKVPSKGPPFPRLMSPSGPGHGRLPSPSLAPICKSPRYVPLLREAGPGPGSPCAIARRTGARRRYVSSDKRPSPHLVIPGRGLASSQHQRFRKSQRHSSY